MYGAKKEKARTHFDLTKRLQKRREISSLVSSEGEDTDDDDDEEKKKKRRGRRGRQRQQQQGVVSVVDSCVGPSAFAEQIIARVEQQTESKIVAVLLYRR